VSRLGYVIRVFTHKVSVATINKSIYMSGTLLSLYLATVKIEVIQSSIALERQSAARRCDWNFAISVCHQLLGTGTMRVLSTQGSLVIVRALLSHFYQPKEIGYDTMLLTPS